MKKIILISLIILFLSVSLSSVYAALGINPASKLYFIQPILESIELFFTFSKEAKIDYLIQLTDRRVEEMNTVPSIKITNRYNGHFERLEKLAAQVQNKKQIVEKIKEVSLRQQEVLAEVYYNVSEPVQELILNAQKNSSKHVEKIVLDVQGFETAQEYIQRVEQIQRTQQIQQLEKTELVPMESNFNDNPSGNIPNQLNPLNPEQELNPLNPVSETINGGENGGQAESVAPTPMQTPIKPQ
jgi:hypothetical protein